MTHRTSPVILTVLFKFIQGGRLRREIGSKHLLEVVNGDHVSRRLKFRGRKHNTLMELRLRDNILTIEARLGVDKQL